MDICGHKLKKSIDLNQSGQTMVEYIMLLAVVVSLFTALVRSSQFQQTFGPGGLFASTYKGMIEYGYRHALGGRDEFAAPNYSEKHDSFEKGGKTRFFGGKEIYPK